MSKKARHVVSAADLSAAEVETVYRTAAATKLQVKRGLRSAALAGRLLGMIFEKPSMRTRVSFLAAMIQAGGHAMDIRDQEIGLGKRESVKDIALVMSRYVDAIMIRAFDHRNVQTLARYSSVPVINGLSDLEHPCQALSDIFTIRERLGRLEGVNLVFVGDGNNVARSLAILCTRLGMGFTLSAPEGHQFDAAFYETAAKRLGTRPAVAIVPNPREAVKNADVIYTDVWTSMGQEAEAEERRKKFRPYQVNSDLVSSAPPGAVIMHCLPAHRGDEISDDVIDSPRSIVYDQAENRLHVQKGLLFLLLGAECT